MAESIGEANWKAFTKKQKLDLEDAALLKALAKFDKTDIAKPEPRVQALDEVVDQAKKQVVALAKKKKELGDKPFNEVKDRLYEVIDGAEKLLKEAHAAHEAARRDEEEGADSPVLLTTKMVALVRELRKGEATMHALIGTAGKNTAVLIMRGAISPSRRNLVGEAIDAKGGAKYIVGECKFEDQALTFVVKAPAAGLAKRLTAAMLAQTQLRLKVRVRGEDPKDVDEDGEDGGEAQAGIQARVRSAPSGGPATAEQLAYTQRLKRLGPRLEDALRSQHPESTKLRGVSGFAAEKSAAGDYTAATRALEMLEKLLTPADAVQAPFDEVAFRKQWAAARSGWQDAIDTVNAQIAKLQDALRATDDRELHAIADKGLNGVTGNHKTPLMAAMIDIDAARGDDLRKRAQKAARIAAAFAEYLSSAETVAATDENEFGVRVSIRDSLGKALREIRVALKPLA